MQPAVQIKTDLDTVHPCAYSNETSSNTEFYDEEKQIKQLAKAYLRLNQTAHSNTTSLNKAIHSEKQLIKQLRKIYRQLNQSIPTENKMEIMMRMIMQGAITVQTDLDNAHLYIGLLEKNLTEAKEAAFGDGLDIMKLKSDIHGLGIELKKAQTAALTQKQEDARSGPAKPTQDCETTHTSLVPYLSPVADIPPMDLMSIPVVQIQGEGQLIVYKEFEPSLLKAIENIRMDEGLHRQREFISIENSMSNGIIPPNRGGVYFAWSDCLGCMKIGATRRDSPQPRLHEISRYMTTPFILSAWLPCSTPFRLEVAAHTHFKDKRINTRGSGAGTEFFDITAEEAVPWVESWLGRPEIHSAAPKRKRNQTGSGSTDTTQQKRQNLERGNIETLVREFIDMHIEACPGHFTATRAIITSLMASCSTANASVASGHAFEKTLRMLILAIFSDQTGFRSTRSSCDGKRLSGYIGICLK